MEAQPESTPSHSAILAAASLLADRDACVVAACRAQLLSWGESTRPVLARLAYGRDARLREGARGLLRTLDLRQWSVRFTRFAATVCWPEGETAGRDSRALEAAALLISAFDRERAPEETAVRAQLEELAGALASRRPGVRTLARLLTERHPLRGRTHRQFEPADVQLDRVLTTGRGCASALSLVYLLVGRRAALRLAGVQLPGHYLVRVHGRRPVLLDPFHAARSITRADCLRYLRGSGYVGPANAVLRDRSDAEVAAALLYELVRVYGYREDVEAVQVLGRAIEALEAASGATLVVRIPVRDGVRRDLPAEPA